MARSTEQEKNPMVVIGFLFYFPPFFLRDRGGGGGLGGGGAGRSWVCGCACPCVWMQRRGKDRVRYVIHY